MDDDDNILQRLLQTGRAAWILAILFVGTGVVYWLLNSGTNGRDPAGPAMLIALGIAMGVGFWVLLRGSSEL